MSVFRKLVRKDYKQSIMLKYLQTWKNKPLHGQFLREIVDQVCIKSQWLWLQVGSFTKEMEGIIFAAQEQALSTNAVRAHIYKMPCSVRCRLCGVADESIDHLVSSCPTLAQKEYKGRHDCIAYLVHWTIVKQAGFAVQDPWWKYSPANVCENNECKLLWDFTIITDTPLQHNRPDITFVLKKKNEVYLINIAIPGDSRLSCKAVEKHTKYVDLKIEVARMWKSKKVFIIPIIVGALGSIPTDLSSYLETPSLPSSLIQTFQKTVLHSTTSLLRRFLNI